MTTVNTEVSLNHDPVSQMLFDQIVAGIKEIEEANEILLGDESGTSVRDIDKAFKADDASDNIPADIMKAWVAYQKAAEKAKALQTEARNKYRVEVLGEEEKAESSISDEDKDVLRDKRKVVMDAVTFLNNYAKANNKADVAEWSSSLEIPQVGRKATSSVGGPAVKRPRVYVKVNGDVYDTFTQAAQALVKSDPKTYKDVTAATLAEAWNSALGEAEGTFQYDGDTEINVTFKNKKS
jgi:hypothetical protein